MFGIWNYLEYKKKEWMTLIVVIRDCGLGMCQFLFEQAMDTVFDEVVELGK